MKKVTLLLPVLFLFFFMSTASFSQSIKIGIGGGLTLFQGPDRYTNDISNMLPEGGLGFSNAFHIAAKAKLDLPLVPITPVGFLEYHFLSASKSYPSGNYETSSDILSIGVGGEISLGPGLLGPYLAIDLAFNKFGKLSITTPSKKYEFDGESRVGLGAGIGVKIGILPVIDLDISAKYRQFNMFGKKDAEETISAFDLSAFIYF